MSVSVTSAARADAKPQAATELLFQPVQVERYHLRSRIVMAPTTDPLDHKPVQEFCRATGRSFSGPACARICLRFLGR